MISPETGGRKVVKGSNMAMPAVGPTPGSTPTRVPRKAPTPHQSTFRGVPATLKENAIVEKISIPIELFYTRVCRDPKAAKK
jgi:hypothetical protein